LKVDRLFTKLLFSNKKGKRRHETRGGVTA